jgi:hypothetical protein
MSEQESQAWAAATAALDRIASEMERLWGVGRLETLVEPDLSAKFATAKAECDAAISSGDAMLAAQKAAAVGRGYGVLHKAALAAGHKPNDTGAVWCAAVDGRRFAVCLHRADVGAVADQYQDHTAVALPELLALLLATEAGRLVFGAKDQWPGAVMTVKPAAKKPEPDWATGDALPF